MKKKLTFAIGSMVTVAAIVAIFALSVKTVDDTKPSAVDQAESSPEAQAIEELGQVYEESTQVVYGPDTNPIPDQTPVTEDEVEPKTDEKFPAGAALTLAELSVLDSLPFEKVRDVAFDYDRVLLATAGGILEFYPADSSFAVFSTPQELHHHDCYALLAIDDNVFAGTDAGVYLIEPTGLVRTVWPEITAQVTSLSEYGGSIYVGTTVGLYEVVGETVELALTNKQVVDVTRDSFALWAATAEDGLLYRDENGWHQRTLLSDSNAFCGATSVVSAFDRTWVGTDHGLYVYNGYNWDLIDTADYLFDSHVTALAPGKSYMYIGTRSEGVFAYSHLNDGIWPLDWSDDIPVQALDIDNGRYLLAVGGEGSILKTRSEAFDVVELVRQTQAVLSAL